MINSLHSAITKPTICIPARFESTRLPNKLLLDKTGKPLLLHTVEAALETGYRVIVLADHPRLIAAVMHSGAEAVLTGPAVSGTDRIRQYVKTQRIPNFKLYINWQADEPEMPVSVISDLMNVIGGDDRPWWERSVASLMCPASANEVEVSSVVKVVVDDNNLAMFFSRLPIPVGGPWYRHVGIYAFLDSFLRSMPVSQSRYSGENLEQLRWLEAGTNIKMVNCDHLPIGIDTLPEYEAFVANKLR